MKHYPFGSSTAGRTDACPPWKKLSEGVPNIESSYAKFGTTVHTLLEFRALDDDFAPSLEMLVASDIVTQEHIDMYDKMWTATEEVLEAWGATEWEAECSGKAAQDIGGTLDLIASSPSRALLIDYKTGFNQVSPLNNKQVLFAAAVCEIESSGADLLADHDFFVGIIIQPDSSGEVRIKEWEFTRDQVDSFWEKHQENIILAREGGGTPVPGSHCAFCPAAATRCPAKNGDALRALQMDASDLEQLSTNMALVEDLKKWCTAVEKSTYNQLELGAPVAGFKLVAKRATEKWRDVNAMIKKLRPKLGGKRALFEEKPLTPAAVRRLAKSLGKEVDLIDLTVKESSGSTIATTDDKRPEVLSADAFKAALSSIQ
jgi:hypothetical protein